MELAARQPPLDHRWRFVLTAIALLRRVRRRVELSRARDVSRAQSSTSARRVGSAAWRSPVSDRCDDLVGGVLLDVVTCAFQEDGVVIGEQRLPTPLFAN